ncbi:MAG TPA: hypothetical protein VMX94_00860 [Armatimonadota bacterium]|nr:hypothetical protein [Armatimonadota bacterium]
MVFADVDIILKLAEYDLLDETCALVEITPSEVRVRRATPIVLRNKRQKLTTGPSPSHTDAGFDRAIAFAENAHAITDRPPDEYHKPLTAVEGIDPGEGGLIATALTVTLDPVILTGDKRCLRALGKSESLKDIHNRLKRRVVCLEEVLRSMILQGSFVSVRDAVSLAPPDCDTAITNAFRGASEQDWERVLEELEVHLRNLEEDVGEGWLKRLS